MFAWIVRSAAAALVAAGVLSQPSIVLGQGRVGPSFDCASEAARTQPLPWMICLSGELSRLELSYVAAYQALRHSLPEAERGALFRDAQAGTERMMRECNLPSSGPATRAATPPEIACLRNVYRDLTGGFHRRSGREALDEATMPPEQLVQLQNALKTRGLLPASAVADGVFGPQTRAAIVAWQQASALRPTGFASPAMLNQILPPSVSTAPPPPAAIPSQPAPRAAPPPPAATPFRPEPPRQATSTVHPVLPLETPLPALDLRLCPTREAAAMQARGPAQPAAVPTTRPPCEHRPVIVELQKPEVTIGPYRAWIAKAAPNGSLKLGLNHDGDMQSVAYEWALDDVRVWQVLVRDREGRTEHKFAEIPERPIEIAFLIERGAWPSTTGKSSRLQVCPAGPSSWLQDKRTSCKVWNPCPQRDETVEWSGRCQDGFAEGTGTTIWRFSGIEHRHDDELQGGKPLEKPEWFTDANNCRIANWLGATASTTMSWTGPCVEGTAQGDGKVQWSGTGTVGGTYAGRLVAGRPDGYGVLNYVNGVSYDGRWAAGLRQGRGMVTYLNGNNYDGDWRENRRTGRGVLVWKDGSRYDGDWQDDRRTGRGTLLDSNGRYEGEWRDDQANGRGVFTWKDGARYEGDWRDDKRTGRGTIVFANGNRYEGDWRDDKRTGRGVFAWKDGARYEGDWRDDNRNGRGTLAFANGNRYEGEWRDDKRNGRGVFTWKDGDRYDGEWRDDKRTGRGVFIWKDGDRYEGDWRDDNRNGRGTLAFANGNRYEGEWRDDKRNGRGVFKWQTGDRYDGEWRDDARSGRGILTWDDGGSYDGSWRDNRRNGYGTQVHANGSRYEGEWRDNRPNGYGTAIIRGESHTGTWVNGCFQQGSRQASFTLELWECGFR